MGQLTKDANWPGSWSAQIGARVRTLRDSAGISAQKLSDKCGELGFPIPRSTIANIESGRKEAIPVHEISIIAAALDVPPAAVLFPLDEQTNVEVLPGVALPPFAAWTRFTDASVSFGVLESQVWDSSSAYLDFLEVLQANIALRRHESTWQVLQGVIGKMSAISDDKAMTSAVLETRARQKIEAEDAGRPMRLLVSKGLPLPQLTEQFESEVRKYMGEEDA